MMTNTNTAAALETTTQIATPVATYHTHEVVQMSYGAATITVLVTGDQWSVTRTDRYPSGNYRTYPVQTYPTRSKALFYGVHRIVREARCA